MGSMSNDLFPHRVSFLREIHCVVRTLCCCVGPGVFTQRCHGDAGCTVLGPYRCREPGSRQRVQRSVQVWRCEASQHPSRRQLPQPPARITAARTRIMQRSSDPARWTRVQHVSSTDRQTDRQTHVQMEPMVFTHSTTRTLVWTLHPVLDS